MHRIVNDEALDSLFRAARSHYAWLARPVGDTLLRALWELVKLAPLSPGISPPHIAFVRSEQAKARLAPALAGAAQAAVMAAPVVAVVGIPAGVPGEGQRDPARLDQGAPQALGTDPTPSDSLSL